MSEPLGAGVEEPVDRNGAFPRLGDEQRARLRAVGMVRKVQAGELVSGDEELSNIILRVTSRAARS
jgi:hypothetical protein